MKKTDINKYNTTTGSFVQEGEQSRSAGATARGIVRAVLRLLVTFLIILGIAGTAAGVTVINFVLDEGSKVEAPRLDLQKLDYNALSMCKTKRESSKNICLCTAQKTVSGSIL